MTKGIGVEHQGVWRYWRKTCARPNVEILVEAHDHDRVPVPWDAQSTQRACMFDDESDMRVLVAFADDS